MMNPKLKALESLLELLTGLPDAKPEMGEMPMEGMDKKEMPIEGMEVDEKKVSLELE
jgi:hypothetical protein